jgi:hypothetical protein
MIGSNPVGASKLFQGVRMRSGARFVFTGLTVAVMTMISACNAIPPVGPATEKQEQELSQSDQQPRVPNEYLVKLAPDANEGVISEYYGRFGIKYVHELEDNETFLLVLSNDPGPQEMGQLIRGESRIKAIQPNLIQWDYR